MGEAWEVKFSPPPPPPFSGFSRGRVALTSDGGPSFRKDLLGQFWASPDIDEEDGATRENEALKAGSRPSVSPLEYLCRTPSPCTDRSAATYEGFKFQKSMEKKRGPNVRRSSLLVSASPAYSDRTISGRSFTMG
jgi:hypothetical protein